MVCLVCMMSVSQAEDGELKTSPLAVAFGSQPDFLSLRLSPEGDKLVFTQYHPDGFEFARVLDLKNLKFTDNLLKDYYEQINHTTETVSCVWANNERLLCMTYQMVGVNYDGKDIRMLEGGVIDLLADDPNHVLISLYAKDFEQMIFDRKTRVGVLDIYTGKVTYQTGLQKGARWFSDGHGMPRLYHTISDDYRRWYARKPKGDKVFWEILHEIKGDNFKDQFTPVGFADNPDELLYLDMHEGRTALFSMDLAHDRTTHLVFAHDRVDVMGVKALGKYDRVVAAAYVDDKFRYYFFDKDIQRIYELITPLFPEYNVGIIDEDWNRRYYLVAVGSDTEPSAYYRYDSQNFKLQRIASISSELKDRKLAPMKEITYPALDKVSIPAFLTLPDGEKKTGLPAVILPHGGPSSRDIWGFDPLVQFLTANGYAVLQSNYRGSTGYGEAWFGDGAFRNWKTVASDVNDGAKYLIDEGIADPNKICVVGWSFGGYAAMMSAIGNPSLYQCIVSIAGVSDPRTLDLRMRRYEGGELYREFIGADVIGDQGSPLKRAGEIQSPVLLVHAQGDVNVPFNHGKLMYEALKKNNKSVEFIQYEQARHEIKPEKYRIDLFTRLAEFLDQHIK